MNNVRFYYCSIPGNNTGGSNRASVIADICSNIVIPKLIERGISSKIPDTRKCYQYNSKPVQQQPGKEFFQPDP